MFFRRLFFGLFRPRPFGPARRRRRRMMRRAGW